MCTKAGTGLLRAWSTMIAYILASGSGGFDSVVCWRYKKANLINRLSTCKTVCTAAYSRVETTRAISRRPHCVSNNMCLAYLLNNQLISRQQFGFLSKCSTCTQLVDCVNDWTLSIGKRHSVDVYFDFTKAFDSVRRSPPQA